MDQRVPHRAAPRHVEGREVKAREIIAGRMRDWRTVDAPTMAEETFAALDADEVERLALRAFTDEWRTELRAKDCDGVPRYASIVRLDAAGREVRLYKQVALFDVDDFAAAIGYHRDEALSHMRAAAALTKRCRAVHGVDVVLPGLEALS